MKDVRPEAPAARPAGLPATLAAELLEQSLRVAPTFALRDIGAQLLAPLLHSTGARRASLMVVNPVTGRLHIAAGVGIRPELIGRDTEWRPNSISEWVYRKRRGLVLNGRVKNDSFTGSAEEVIESAMCLPLETDAGVLGVLNLARTAPAPVFGEGEMNALRDILPPVAAAIERACGAARGLRLRQQLAQASGLAGYTVLQPGGYESRQYEFGFARLASALEGGDVCERVPFANGSHALCAADASGDGVDAVLAAAYVLGLFVGGAAPDRGVAAHAGRLNHELFQRRAGRVSVAAWFAHLASGGLLTSCNAGYPPPLWVPSDDSPIVRLVSGGPAIGTAAGGNWDEEQVRLLGGDIVVAVSDGVLGAQNVTGSAFGDERVLEIVGELRRHPLDVLVNEVLAAARDWSGRERPTDDLSVLAVRYRPWD